MIFPRVNEELSYTAGKELLPLDVERSKGRGERSKVVMSVAEQVLKLHP
jgi:hypothetical protein